MRLASSGALKSPTTPRSILKRPTPLPLSPSAAVNLQFSASFSVHVSPSSPHVHFPTSAKLTSTFMAHSPSTYDRAAIVVSPNPLAIPSYGDRVYSPTSGVFKNSKLVEEVSSPAPKAVEEAHEFKLEPPPAPEVTKPAKVKQTRASVRFQQNLANNKPAPLPRDNDLPSALLKFPRSPYPTAPASPAGGKENMVAETRPKVNSAREVGRVAKRPASVKAEEVNTAAIDEDKLSQDFWRSVTFVGAEPLSQTPTFVFGTQEGDLWSPGLPPAQRAGGMESIMSPFSRTSFAKNKMTNPQAILSPTPNDTFASFPSFGTVLSTRTTTGITYPPRAIVEL